jgi:hypothetical protein
MAKDDHMQPNGYLHVRRGPERSIEHWQARLEEIEDRHARRRRGLDQAIAAYRDVAAEMATLQAEERKRPVGRDAQAEFGEALEQARLKAERERFEFHSGRLSDLNKLALEAGRERDKLIAELAGVRELERVINQVCEQIRTAIWYCSIETDEARNAIAFMTTQKEEHARTSRELPTEERRHHGYGRGLL